LSILTVQVKSAWYLVLFTILFIGLGLGYASLTPIFEHSDETLHYPYVKHLADGNGLPVAEPGRPWNQEGTQPPLYYALVAASTFWIDTDNLAEHLQRNPHWLFTEVRALINDNQNLVLHGPMDSFPYRRTALAIHIGRWWSLAFGMATVICTFLIARRLFPSSLPLAITATALTALTPQFIRVSATVSNDSLSAALTSLTVLLALTFTDPPRGQLGRITGRRAWPLVPPLLLGLLAGLALLTKLSSLSTALLAAFIIFWRLFFLSEDHQRPFQRMGLWLLIIGVIVAGMSGWWFYRNYSLYGEWLATETHLNLAGRGQLSLSEIWELRPEIERAYWATFSWGQIRPPEWVYQLLRWFSGIALFGLGLAVLARLIQGDRARPISLNLKEIDFEKIVFLLFWAGLNLALYLRWVMEVGSVSHTRLIFPAITAISLLLALGWHALLPPRLAGWFSGLVTASLLALNIYSLGWLIYPAFRPPAAQLTAQAAPLELTFAGSMQLVGGEVYRGGAGLEQAAVQGDLVMIRAGWQTIAPIAKNYSVAAILLGPDGEVLARRETYPGLGLRPTRYLVPGDRFVDLYPLQLAVDVPGPLVAQAVVNLFDLDSPERAGLPALAESGDEVRPVVGQIKIVPKNWPQYQPKQAASVDFGGAIRLIGYDPGPTLTLYWQSLAPVKEDYHLFIHLLDAQGNVVAQADRPPTHNAYPTSWWAAGETIADLHPLPAAAQASQVRFGFYSLVSGERLPVTQSSLPSQDNSVALPLAGGNDE
jgi:hypothetical protein